MPEVDETRHDEDLLTEADGFDSEDDDDEDEPIVIPKFLQGVHWYWDRRRKTVPLTVALILIILMIIPLTRYRVAGMVWKRDFQLQVIDEQTGFPVSDARVELYGQQVRTDATGIAHFSQVPTGIETVRLQKPYYEATDIKLTIGFKKSVAPQQIRLKATGRLVPVSVINKITGKPIGNVKIAAGESSAITNDQGEATMVLPPDGSGPKATFSTEGFNELSGDITISQQVVAANTFAMTPAGTVYYLSADLALRRVALDGSGDQAVLDDVTQSKDGFSASASNDWRYVVFAAQRDFTTPSLYLYDTETEKLSRIDGGEGDYVELYGWSGTSLYYGLIRGEVSYWGSSRVALKRYDAANGKTVIIDQNDSVGGSVDSAVFEQFNRPRLLDDGLIYAKTWVKQPQAEVNTVKQDSLWFASTDQEQPEQLYAYDVSTFSTRPRFEIVVTKPNRAIVRYAADEQTRYIQVENGLAVNEGIRPDAFAANHPDYLPAPGKLNVLWRDKQGQLLVGNQYADDGYAIEASGDYYPYGWQTDQYIVVAGGAGALYIMPSNGLGTVGKRLKLAENVMVPAAPENNGGYALF